MCKDRDRENWAFRNERGSRSGDYILEEVLIEYFPYLQNDLAFNLDDDGRKERQCGIPPPSGGQAHIRKPLCNLVAIVPSRLVG
jgi:hypothetical protein